MISLIINLISTATNEIAIQVNTSTSTPVMEKIVNKHLALNGDISVLERIAKCESNNQHFDENGEVLRGVQVKEDIGRWQINTRYWGEKAEELGIDIFDEEGNRAMAEYILKTVGTKAWYPSKHCWSK